MIGLLNHKTPHKQSGFTLLELLIALVLVLVVIIGVQRFMAGVVVDQQDIGTRQNMASDSRIVLSNIARDVAQANFYPVSNRASAFSATPTPLAACTGSGSTLGSSTACQNVLGVQYAAPAGAKDCTGSAAPSSPLVPAGWVLVNNRYVLTTDSGVVSLSCEGNGNSSLQLDLLDNVLQFSATASNSSATLSNVYVPVGTRLLHLCVLTKVAQINADAQAAHSDCAGAALAEVAGWVFYKTELDVLVEPASFAAGM